MISKPQQPVSSMTALLHASNPIDNTNDLNHML